MNARPGSSDIGRACRRFVTRWREKAESGAAAIELAVVLPVFVLMSYGGMEISHYAYTRLALSDAAREGTRYAMVHGAASSAPASAGAIQTYVRSRIALIDGAQVTVTTTFTPDNNPGSLVKVAVSYPFAPFVPGFDYLTARTLTSSAQMTIAQ